MTARKRRSNSRTGGCRQRARIFTCTLILSALTLLCAAAAAACQPQPSPAGEEFLTGATALEAFDLQAGQKLKVVATTNLVSDTLHVVGGDLIDLQPLLPRGADPHAYQPTPGDLRKLTEADLIFINGLGLEEALHPALSEAARQNAILSISERIEPLTFTQNEPAEDQEADQLHEHSGSDPHVWMDPANVKIWAGTAADALSAADPGHADRYQQNADEYLQSLDALDNWISAQIVQIPSADRKLVSDHRALGYFAARYGFELVAAIIPAYSTASEPSARDLAELIDLIHAERVPAIFVGTNANTTLADRIAGDAGVRVAALYTGALSQEDGPAGTYLKMMKYNVETIVACLADGCIK